MNERITHARSLPKQVHHTGNILMLGCGAVARASLPLLFQLVDFDPAKLTIIDFVDVKESISSYLKQGAQFHKIAISPDNYATVLAKYLKQGDLLLDLSWNIDTNALLSYCHDHGILYINTSVEVWDPYTHNGPLQDATLYARHQSMRSMIKNWQPSDRNPTAILDHGANPGFISHLVKKGITDIVTEQLLPFSKVSEQEKETLRSYLKNNNFNLLAQAIGLKVIHISERDTQIANDPKKPKEFVNTWSVEGFIEEGVAPAELGWGTHEKIVPKNGLTHAQGNKNQICLESHGMNTY